MSSSSALGLHKELTHPVTNVAQHGQDTQTSGGRDRRESVERGLAGNSVDGGVRATSCGSLVSTKREYGGTLT
jgi:hypothetical protein